SRRRVAPHGPRVSRLARGAEDRDRAVPRGRLRLRSRLPARRLLSGTGRARQPRARVDALQFQRILLLLSVISGGLFSGRMVSREKHTETAETEGVDDASP